MVQKEITKLLHELGKIFNHLAAPKEQEFALTVLTHQEFRLFEAEVISVERLNPWFTESNIRKALGGLSILLNEHDLQLWINQYIFPKEKKNVAIIMAGNIPLVGFHDFLCVLLSGHHAVCKLSSQDSKLWMLVLDLLVKIDPRISEHFTINTGKLTGFDAVIATGSNNTAVSFHHYFSKYPNIIRHNRTSIAVLSGDESDEALQNLADDVFSYFGFGCRNVTQIFVPDDFNLDRLFENFLVYKTYINHNKYMNNFDYYRALFLMNGESFLENGFVMMRFNESLHAPPSVINCSKYKSIEQVEQFIQLRKEEIQLVAGRGGIVFGQAQYPGLMDYADGVDVMNFLGSL